MVLKSGLNLIKFSRFNIYQILLIVKLLCNPIFLVFFIKLINSNLLNEGSVVRSRWAWRRYDEIRRMNALQI
jgi:hypothetical protein